MIQSKDSGSLAARIKSGRLTGRYTFEECSLLEIPDAAYNQAPVPYVNFWEEVDCKSLNVSHNEIGNLPDALAQLSSLEMLDLRHNVFSGSMRLLPCAKIKVLHLCHNKLTSMFDTDQIVLPALVQLFCSHNTLQRLDLQPASSLKKLDASYNALKEIPDLSEQTPHIQDLVLSNNQLSKLSFAKGLTGLKHLDLASNSFRQLPASIVFSTQLTFLDLQSNQLLNLPQELSQLGHLETLLLGRNQLTGLPVDLAGITSLKTLELQDNELASIPPQLSRLGLTQLNLANNNLSSLPYDLGRMTSLKSMPISGNPLRGIRPSLLEGPLRNLLEALSLKLQDAGPAGSQDDFSLFAMSELDITRMIASKDICLKGRRLEKVPPWVWEAGSDISRLDLSDNGLTDVEPSQLACLVNLKQLQVQGNKLSTWPLPKAGSPLQLQQLDASDNAELQPAADSFCQQAGTLTCLSLSGLTRLRTTDCLESLLKLRELHLSRCRLAAFPCEAVAMHQLTCLTLDTNQIPEIPETISRLTALVHLDLRNNDLARLPPQLGLLSECLHILLLDGNPLRTIRRPILDRGTKAVLAYLADRLPQT